PVSRADDPQGRQSRPQRRRDPRGGEQERARGDPQVLDDLGGPDDEAAASCQRLGEGAHPQVDPLLHAEQLAGARPPRPPPPPGPPAAAASSPITGAPGRAHSSTMSHSGAPSPSIEKTPSTPPSAPLSSACARVSARSSRSMRLWRNGRILAFDSSTPSRMEAWSAEATITVAPTSSRVPSVPTVAWGPVAKPIA